MVFCDKCAEDEFKTNDPPRLEREKYLKWLEVYKAQI
jgi:hypothetical protein